MNPPKKGKIVGKRGSKNNHFYLFKTCELSQSEGPEPKPHTPKLEKQNNNGKYHDSALGRARHRWHVTEVKTSFPFASKLICKLFVRSFRGKLLFLVNIQAERIIFPPLKDTI